MSAASASGWNRVPATDLPCAPPLNCRRNWPTQLADELRHHKTEIIRLLTATAVMMPSVAICKEWGAVPPYNLELVTLKPTPTPVNRDLIIAYLSRQCAIGSTELRAWLTCRRAAYVEMTAGTWDTLLITYAVAREASFRALRDWPSHDAEGA